MSANEEGDRTRECVVSWYELHFWCLDGVGCRTVGGRRGIDVDHDVCGEFICKALSNERGKVREERSRRECLE